VECATRDAVRMFTYRISITPTPTHVTSTPPLAELVARLAYQEGDFTLASGRKSTFYLDAKQVSYHPDSIRAVGRGILGAIADLEVEAIGGLTMGADPIIAATVWASAEAGTPLTGFVVRKEAKGHGLGKWIEGVHPKGKRVAILDDVITTGGSSLKAVEQARAAGAEVVAVVGLVDREEGGADLFRAEGLEYRAVCRLSEVRAAAASG